ncbi:hypothetical protein ACJQWK_03153 [Exserohilum turcicum]
MSEMLLSSTTIQQVTREEKKKKKSSGERPGLDGCSRGDGFNLFIYVEPRTAALPTEDVPLQPSSRVQDGSTRRVKTDGGSWYALILVKQAIFTPSPSLNGSLDPSTPLGPPPRSTLQLLST